MERVPRGREVGARVRIGLPREHRFQEAVALRPPLPSTSPSAFRAGSHSLRTRVGRDRHRPRGGPRNGRPHHRRGRSPAATARATIEQRAPGVPAGLGVAEAVFARLDPGSVQRRWPPRGVWREPGPLAELERLGRGDPGRRARGAQLPRPALRRGHAHRALRPGGRGHGRAHPRHAQDHAGPARAREGGRARGRRHQPPPRPLRRGARQGEPLGAGRRGGGGHSPGARRGSRRRDRGGRVRDPRRGGGGAGGRRGADPARQHGPGRAAPRRSSSWGAAPSSRHRAA